LGVLPYRPLNLGFEDSQSLLNYRQIKSGVEEWRVGVILYPYVSNYNDLEPLILNPKVEVEFIRGDMDLKSSLMRLFYWVQNLCEDWSG